MNRTSTLVTLQDQNKSLVQFFKTLRRNCKVSLFIFVLTMIPLTGVCKDGAPAPAKTSNSNLPILIVGPFKPAAKVDWPYAPSQIQAKLAATLRAKDGNKFDIVMTAPEGPRNLYLLGGEITAYNAGKKFSPFGCRREHATIHYWIIDSKGEKVFQHWDTIRQPYGRYMGYSDAEQWKYLTGELTKPLTDKIASRLKHFNLP